MYTYTCTIYIIYIYIYTEYSIMVGAGVSAALIMICFTMMVWCWYLLYICNGDTIIIAFNTSYNAKKMKVEKKNFFFKCFWRKRKT